MKILVILQNAWGGRKELYQPIFHPNPYNHSAKVMRKIVGDENEFFFCNTTDEVGARANVHYKTNDEHFKRLIPLMKNYDIIFVGGRQAETAVRNHMDKIKSFGKPIIFNPHPAARNLTNKRCYAIRRVIEIYERVNKKT